MFKLLINIMFCVVISINGLSQNLTKQTTSNYLYHPPSQDKLSWQRLNLWLGSTFLLVVKEGQADLDVCLLQASRSLGLSRISILSEGINDVDLLAQSQWIDQRDPGNGLQMLSKATGRKHVELLMLLGAYYVFQPNNYQRYKDSVEYFLAKAVDESKAIGEERLGRQARCLLVKMYAQANELKKSDAIFIPLMKECKVTGDKETEARVFAYRGIYTRLSPTTWSVMITDLQKAADIYSELKNTEGQINALTDIGYLYVLTKQLDKSYSALLKAFQLQQEIEYPYTQYNTDVLALVTSSKGQYGEPLRYTLQSIRASENSRDSIGWAYFYERLASLYNLVDAKEKRNHDWLSKAIDRYVLDGNPYVYNILNTELFNMCNDGRIQEALDRLKNLSLKLPPVNLNEQTSYHIGYAMCYINLRMFELGKHHLLKADSLETIAESIRGPLKRSGINAQFGDMYFAQGQYLKAKTYYEEYYNASPGTARLYITDISIMRRLIETDSILREPHAGLAHYRKYVELLTSSFDVSMLRQAEELQVIYQTEEKQNQITLLNQRAKLEKANLKQATLVKNLSISGVVAVLIIAGLFYRQGKLTKKSNIVITQKNEQLQHYLTEKEWLLKEIHHRVKNNLQIVMSLLNSQSAYIENDAALTAIHDSQHRVHAMSLIHQKLYNTENVSSIDMSSYIRELVSYLGDSFNTGQRIRFELKVESLNLDVSQAVPLGLILNEAITNSIKYAFPNEREGVVKITLSNTSGNQYLLEITDNGIGIPSQFKNENAGSLGMSLIAGLTEDLNGNLLIENNNGTMIKIIFVLDRGIERSHMLTSSLILKN